MNIPKYVVSVKAAIFENGRMLVIKKKMISSGEIYYGVPGGIIEYDENPEEALKREVREEMGLEIEPIIPILVVKYKHPKGDWNVKIYYLCKIVSGELRLKGEEDQEFLGIAWVNENDEIQDYLREEIRMIKLVLKQCGIKV